MKRLCNCIVFFFITIVSCQNDLVRTITPIANLSKQLKETSGIANLSKSDTFWLINDSGNSNELFEINDNGKILSVVEVVNAKNQDWEDLASDGAHKLFIGDFGNNNNKRKDLRIYSVAVNQILNNKVTAEVIDFYFEDQHKFPPNKKHRNFDIEAFVYKAGYFYLFTKNRSSEFNGETKLYKIAAEKGKQKAILIDSFVTCNKQTNCAVTSATLSKDKKTLVLLTPTKLYEFTNYIGDDFFKGNVKVTDLEHKSQKEAICFKDGMLYITDERVKNKGGNLYLVK